VDRRVEEVRFNDGNREIEESKDVRGKRRAEKIGPKTGFSCDNRLNKRKRNG
jgi:hypothetical protein